MGQAAEALHRLHVFAAVTILLVMVAVGLLLNPSQEDFVWFLRLRRPAWLSFERLIPLIWISIYACFWWSALLSWQARASWALMLGYLGLLLLVQSYTLVICRTRRLAAGTWIGFSGWLWGMALAVVLARQVPVAALLLVPYLIWSPLGTLVTWQMQRLNR
jgi:translocator protein